MSDIKEKIKKFQNVSMIRHASVPTSQDQADIAYLLNVIEMQNVQIEMYTQHLSAIRQLLALELQQEFKKEKQC